MPLCAQYTDDFLSSSGGYLTDAGAGGGWGGYLNSSATTVPRWGSSNFAQGGYMAQPGYPAQQQPVQEGQPQAF